ncbi:MAG: amino acid adenylation domain-containing protein [Acidimicrobiales bacterium]
MTVHDVTTRARHQPVVVRRFGLTPIQIGMLFEGQMQGKPSVFLQQIVLRMPGESLDIPTFEDAWGYVQARHEALRTSYAWEGLEEPEQTVWSEAVVVTRTHDWRGQDAEQVDRSLEQWLASNRDVGYDVTALPTIRLDVFHVGRDTPELGDGEPSTILVWTNHHVHIDGRSSRLLHEELFDIYERLLAGRTVEVAPAPRFADHAAAVALQDLDGAKQYIRRWFAGFDEPIDLGLAVGAGGDVPVAGTALRVLPADVMDRLQARSKEAGGSLGTAMMVAWSVVVGRYSRRDRVVFGSTRAGRHTTPDAADIIGCLINTVPMIATVRSDVTIADVYAELRRQQLEVRPYEHMPLADVQTWSDMPRGTPLFETDVVFENYRSEDQLRALGGNWVNRSLYGVGDVEIGLMFRGFIRAGLELHIDFDENRFDVDAMERMADHCVHVLTQMADTDFDACVGSLELLDDDELHGVIEARNPSPLPYEHTIADAFEAIASSRPAAPALRQVGDATTMSYRELDARADRWAKFLRDAGVRPDQRVALFLPRSTEFVVSVLAVAKSGGAWVPMDPSYPAEALAHMLTDSGAGVVLTTSSLVGRLPACAARVVCVDDPAVQAEVACMADGRADRSDLRPDHLAYVIYTSGSTGKPKGVLVEQHALAQYVQCVIDLYGFEASDRLMQFSALSFDTSVEELWSPLLCGATLVLRDDETAGSVGALLDTVEREGITFIGTPTAFWHVLVQHLEETEGSVPRCVRGVIVGGEKASRRAFDTWRRVAPWTKFINGYGPTEVTIACTFWVLEAGQEFEAGREVPIGQPSSMARLYVLDGEQRPMPAGVAGELWVGGPGVARGYLNRPELTADRFRPDPFSSLPGARMYRTGDLVRWDLGADVEYLGRMDRQVKYRGYRIEPAEVEGVLEQHPQVARAIVGVHGEETSARLVAWIVPGPDGPPDQTELREFASGKLGPQLVPATFVVIDRIPETPGGKVDLRALPAPEVRPVERDLASKLADVTGAIVQDCFASVLKLDEVGADESFFDLGGHSLMAMKLIERLHRAVGRRLTLGELHHAPTPRAISALLKGQQEGPVYEHLLPIQPKGSLPPLFGVHVLGPNAVWYRPLSERLGPDQPVMGLWIANPDVNSPVAIADIARRYADEIEQWCPSGPVGLAGISLGGFVAYELAQQLKARGREITVLAMMDTGGPDGRPQLEGFARVRRHLAIFRQDGLEYVRTRVHGKLWKRAERKRAAEASRLQETGDEISPEVWMSKFVELNNAAAREYEVLPYDGRITVFHASKVSFDRPDAVASGLGWDRYAQRGVEVIDVPGDHMTILAEPHVAVLARHLRDVLSPH